MIVPIPTKPLQRSFPTPNEGGVFGATHTTSPSNISGSQPNIFQPGGSNFFLGSSPKPSMNGPATTQIGINNSHLAQGQPNTPFFQSGNSVSQGIFGQQQTSNTLSSLIGPRQDQANTGASSFALPTLPQQNIQQPNFVKGGLFNQASPGDNNSPNQVTPEKVSHGQHTALSLGLFGQSLSQASNHFGITNQNDPNKSDANRPFSSNQQQSPMFNTSPKISAYQAYFDSAQKKPTGGFKIDPNQTEFSLPSLTAATKQAPKLQQFKPVRSKNSKLAASELVQCITALDQFSKMSKEELRVQFIKSGGMQNLMVFEQVSPKNNNKLALGLASYIARGGNHNNAFGNVAQSQSTTGLFGNHTSTPSFFNQNNQQISNIALPNQTHQNTPQSVGAAANSYNQPPLLPSFFGSQANSPVVSPNFTGNNNFSHQQNSIPAFQSQINPNINEHQNHQYSQDWTNQVQTQSDFNHFPQYQQPAQQAQYSSDFGYMPQLNIHLTPEQISSLFTQQEQVSPIYQQSDQKAVANDIKKTYGRLLMNITAEMARINALHPKSQIQRELNNLHEMGDHGPKDIKALYREICRKNLEVEYAQDDNAFTYRYPRGYAEEQRAWLKDKPCYFLVEYDSRETEIQSKHKRKSQPIHQQSKLSPLQKQQKRQQQFLQYLPRVGSFSTFPSIQRLKLYSPEQLKKIAHFKIWNDFGCIEFREPISILQADLKKHITIAQDCIEITDYYLQTKRHWMTFVNMGNYTSKRPEEQRLLKKKIRRWVEEWRMKEILHDGHNGNLIVEPPILPAV